MKCLIITNETGVSFQFDDLINEGSILLLYKDTGLSLRYPFSNTNFIMLPAGYFQNRGSIELKVISNKIIIAQKKITNYTLINKAQ